jgi:small redox-active disulfide protein 2
MHIKVLGPGCGNCARLEANTHDALTELGMTASIEKVTDVASIVGYGIMSTPGLVVDGRVVSSGRVPSVDDIKRLIAAG